MIVSLEPEEPVLEVNEPTNRDLAGYLSVGESTTKKTSITFLRNPWAFKGA